MARRADHTREELTELIIKAGLKIIEKEGFTGFSARKLASSIGYTVGTLYNVFGSYDGLMLHINARTLDHWYAYMQTRLNARKKTPALRVLAQAYVDYSREHHNLWSTLFDYHIEQEAIPEWYMKRLENIFSMLEDILLQEMMNPSEAKRAAQILWSGIHGICVLHHTRKLDLMKTHSADVLASSFIDTFMRGLREKSYN